MIIVFLFNKLSTSEIFWTVNSHLRFSTPTQSEIYIYLTHFIFLLLLCHLLPILLFVYLFSCFYSSIISWKFYFSGCLTLKAGVRAKQQLANEKEVNPLVPSLASYMMIPGGRRTLPHRKRLISWYLQLTR